MVSERDMEFLDLSGVHEPQAKPEQLDATRFPVLEGMTAIHLRILNSTSRVMHVSEGVELLHEGDTPHDLYFVYSGKLEIGKHIDGELKILASLKPGDVYGEFGILRKKSRYASVFTVEPSRIIRVELSTIYQIMEADTTLKKRLETLLYQRILDSFFFSHPAFRHMPTDIRATLTRELKTKYVERNTRLFSQGDTPTGVYLILSGEAEVRHLNRSQKETLLEVRRDGDILGELTQNHGKALAYSAIASGNLDLLPLNRQTMQAIRELHPETAKALETYINDRAARTVERIKKNLG